MRLHLSPEYAKEAVVRDKIKASLVKKICTDPQQIEEKKQLYEDAKLLAEKEQAELLLTELMDQWAEAQE